MSSLLRLTPRRLAVAVVVTLVAACSSLSTLQRLDGLSKSAKQMCTAAPAVTKLSRCHLALACAEPVSVAQHKVLIAETKMQAMEASDNERAVAAVAIVAAEAACKRAGVVVDKLPPGNNAMVAAVEDVKARLDAVAVASRSVVVAGAGSAAAAGRPVILAAPASSLGGLDAAAGPSDGGVK